MKAVILRACDFFVFPQKWTLKTNGLRTKKSRKFKKVTNSERSHDRDEFILGSSHFSLPGHLRRIGEPNPPDRSRFIIQN